MKSRAELLGVTGASPSASAYCAGMDKPPFGPGPLLAIDIGGTKLAAGVVDASGHLGCIAQRPTVGADGEALFSQLTGLIDEVLANHRSTGGDEPVAVGVGCGGPMAAGGVTVTPLNITQWQEFPLRNRLATHTGLPTWVDNDAKALALAEGRMGAARGEPNYMAMVVSTGVGAGIVVDGRLLDGSTDNAGHLGHVVVVPDGRPCACGSRGCLEAEASGSAIAARTGRPAAEADEAERRRVGTLVGRAVASAVVLCDLRLACVGGSVGLGYGATLIDAANAELARVATIPFAKGARVVPVGLGADGPLLGAALVALRHLI